MSSNEGAELFTGGDYAMGVHGNRFVKRVAAIHTHAAAQRPEGRPNQTAEQEIQQCVGTPRVHRVPGHASLQITVGTVISAFLADALPRSAA